MRRLLVCCLLVVAPTASAAPDDSVRGLREGLSETQRLQRDNRSEIRALERRLRVDRRARADGRGRADASRRRAERASRRLRRERAELDRKTLEYVSVAGSVGARTEEPEAAALGAAVGADAGDAALVYAVAGSLLRSSGDRLSELRAQAVETASARIAADEETRRARAEAATASARIADAASRLRWARLGRIELRTTVGLTRRAIRSRNLEIRRRAAYRVSGGGIILDEQAQFAYQLAALTGLDVNVIRAWTLAEMSGDAARGRAREGSHNWLNIGYFDSLRGEGAFQRYDVWRDPIVAANASAAFLAGKWLGASPGIQDILDSVGAAPEVQLRAIAESGWASSGYYGGASLRGTYRLVRHVRDPRPTRARVVIDERTVIRVP